MATRTFHCTTEIVVGFTDGKHDYTPAPTNISKPITQANFKTPINEWKTLMYNTLYTKYYNAAVEEAGKMGTYAYLKSFDMYNIKATGETKYITTPTISPAPTPKPYVPYVPLTPPRPGKPKATHSILQRIKYLEDVIEDSTNKSAKLQDQISEIERIPKKQRTEEQKKKLYKLTEKQVKEINAIMKAKIQIDEIKDQYDTT